MIRLTDKKGSLLPVLLAAAVMLSAGTAAWAQSGGAAPGAAVSPNASLVAPGSTLETVLFYVVGGGVALAGLGCVLSVNIVRMAVCLFATLSAVAVLYFLMAANFLAAIQLIVYAGGTLVLIIFGVMLTSKSPFVKYLSKRVELVTGGIVCLLLFGGLTVAITRTHWAAAAGAAPAGYSVAQIGTELLTTYLVPFELASVLLLAVMIGAAYLARPQRGGAD